MAVGVNKTISLEEAQRLVLEAAKPVATEKVLLENAKLWSNARKNTELR